jgi:hypothetical protein
VFFPANHPRARLLGLFLGFVRIPRHVFPSPSAEHEAGHARARKQKTGPKEQS